MVNNRMTNPFKKLQASMNQFVAARDWDQFHTPKNLTMALTVEAAELQECFQWLTDAQSMELNEQQLAAVSDEIADVQLYLIRLADKLNIDIEAACLTKMEKNRAKYPVEKSKGKTTKYTSFQD